MENYINTLKKLEYVYSMHENEIDFICLGNECKVNADGKIFVSDSLFGYIPHVMRDGAVCTSSNFTIILKEIGQNDVFELVVGTYLPWLLGMSAPKRVAEFISEIDYFIKEKFHYKSDIKKNKPNDFTSKVLASPTEMWEVMESLDDFVWYRFHPLGMPSYDVYIRKIVSKKKFEVFFDEKRKASQRVLGLDFKSFNVSDKLAFIGVGSVNSYIIKQALARNAMNICLFDNDLLTTGNAFRHAFPVSKGLLKIKCVEKFAKLLDPNINVEKHQIKLSVDKITKNYLLGVSKVFISVDDPFSWIGAFLYTLKYAEISTEVILTGVDAFGGYGKVIKLVVEEKTETIDKDLYASFVKFMTYTNTNKRNEMIGNGCGKSLSIYDEISLLKLADKTLELIFKEEHYGEIIDVQFK